MSESSHHPSRLIPTFLLEAWEGLAGLEEATEGLRTFEARRAKSSMAVLAHRMKGSAGLYGFPQLAALSGRLEEAALMLADEPGPPADELIALFKMSLGVIPEILGQIGEGKGDSDPRLAELHRLFDQAAEVPVGTEDEAPPGEPTVDELLHRFRVENPRVLAYFGPEVEEHIDALDEGLGQLERNPEDRTTVDLVFRAAHTLKGAAYTVGCEPIGDLSHRLEERLVPVRRGTALLSGATLRLMNEGTDVLRAMLVRIRGGSSVVETAFQRVVESLDRLPVSEATQPVAEPPLGEPSPAEPSFAESTVAIPVPTEAAAAFVAESAASAVTELGGQAATEAATPRVGLEPAAEALEPAAGASTIRVDLKRMDGLLNLVGEMLISRSRLDQHLDALERVSEQMVLSRRRLAGTVADFEAKYMNPVMTGVDDRKPVTSTSAGAGSTAAELFDELEFDRYDDFNILARQIDEMSSDLVESQGGLAKSMGLLREDVDQIQRLIRDLRTGIGRVRMVPIGQLFARFTRLVRRASQETGKLVTLELNGENVEVDNAVVERIAGPLTHLVQNAIYHGLEDEEGRLAAGKPRQGALILSASPQGQFIQIEVEDDGGGIDVARLKAAALAQGFRSRGELDGLPDEEALELVYLPGLSTAEKVTTGAGRGVGMDVVRNNIARLNGEIRIESESGVGTRMTLKIPLTLLVSEALMVRVGGSVFGMPLPSVRRLLNVGREEVRTENGEERLTIEDEEMALLRAEDILGLQAQGSEEHLSIVLLNVGGRTSALRVDEVVGIEEVVIRSLGDFMGSVPLYSGATITGEGEVVLVLDAQGLLATADQGLTAFAVSEEPLAGVSRVSSVLLVDDSLSVRRVLGDMLSRAGFEVETANDGVMALEILRERSFDAVLTDLEMPRLNGYELLEDLRRREATRHLPIFVITTRAGAKHLDVARQLGATAYFSKPIDEDELVSRLRAVLAAPAGDPRSEWASEG